MSQRNQIWHRPPVLYTEPTRQLNSARCSASRHAGPNLQSFVCLSSAPVSKRASSPFFHGYSDLKGPDTMVVGQVRQSISASFARNFHVSPLGRHPLACPPGALVRRRAICLFFHRCSDGQDYKASPMGQVRQSNSAAFARKARLPPCTGEVHNKTLRDGPRQQRGTGSPHNLHTRARPGSHGKDSEQRPPPPLQHGANAGAFSG